MKPDLRSMTLPELKELLEGWGEPDFRAVQLFEWMHRRHAASFEEMTNLSGTLRSRLGEECFLCTARPVQVLTSRIDGTGKYLMRFSDGNVVECVRMRYHYGSSVCISSQVGCAMGCRFCASTIGGKVRDLSAGEMLEQVYRIQAANDERISGVVVMGSGEPLDNYGNLLRFLHLLTDERGLNLSARSITVSTCGIVPGIRALAREKLQITLALSLHATTQEERRELMPIAGRYPLDKVLDACAEYFSLTGRRVTLEYSLVKGVNDSEGHAVRLSKIARSLKAHMNLIPVNPVAERTWQKPDPSAVRAFHARLVRLGANATVRREMGADINGACGQLRRGFLETQEDGEIRE